MTYETILIILVATGVLGLGFLLGYLGEIVWHLERRAGKPGVIITDAVFLSMAWMLIYGGLSLSRLAFNVPANHRMIILFIAVGFAVIPWLTLLRWLRWRHSWEEYND